MVKGQSCTAGGVLTSIHVAFLSAHSWIDLRRVMFGVSVIGLVNLWPVAGHLRLP